VATTPLLLVTWPIYDRRPSKPVHQWSPLAAVAAQLEAEIPGLTVSGHLPPPIKGVAVGAAGGGEALVESGYVSPYRP